MKLKRVCYLLSGCLLILWVFGGTVSAQSLCPFDPDPHPVPNVWPFPIDPVIDHGDGTCSYAEDPVVDYVYYSCVQDGQLPPPPDFECEPVNLTVTKVTPLAPTPQSGSSSGGCGSTSTTNTVQTVQPLTTPVAPAPAAPTVTVPPKKCTVTTVSPPTTSTQKTYSVTTNGTQVKPTSKPTTAPSVVTKPQTSDEITSIDML